jgi:hypothetical protein
MRSMFRGVPVALAVVFAVGAVAAASASASLPEFVWTQNPNSYSGTSGAVTLQTVKGVITVSCQASKDVGEPLTSNKRLTKAQIVYTGCKAQETACTSTGAASGEVRTNLLTAELVYTNKAAKEVGLVFKPEAVGGAVAEYNCGGLVGKVKLTGSVIAKLPNEQVNKSRTSLTWDYRQKAGVQEPAEYEEGTTKIPAFLTLHSSLSGNFQAGEETTETMTFTSAVEVKA